MCLNNVRLKHINTRQRSFCQRSSKVSNTRQQITANASKGVNVNYQHCIAQHVQSPGLRNNWGERWRREKESSSVNERQHPSADLLPSSGAVEEVWTKSDSCTPGYTSCPAPPDICRWWSGAPWLDRGFGYSSHTRKYTGKNRDRKHEGTEEDLFFFTVYWYSHQSVHPQIFPSVSDSTG